MTKKLIKSLGQNFLINENIAKKICTLATQSKNNTLLEIGCGNGAITKHLKNIPYKKYSIVELDRRWAKFATEEYQARNNNITVYNEDILSFSIKKNELYSIVGNIPFNITYPIIEKVISSFQQITEVIFIMQNEVAEKLAKKNGKSYAPLSIICQLFFDITLHEKISPESFNPPPKVFSRIIKFNKKEKYIFDDRILEQFRNFLAKVFRFPRKKIKNQGLPQNIISRLDSEILEKRAQEIECNQMYTIFKKTIR